MPRKRKVADGTGTNETRPDTPGEETGTKAARKLAKSPARNVGASSRKTGNNQTKAPKVEPVNALREESAAPVMRAESSRAEFAGVLKARAADAANIAPLQSARAPVSPSKPSEPEPAIMTTQKQPVETNKPGSSPATYKPEVKVPQPTVPVEEQIALLAYSYWEARGRQDGSAEEDWFRAEREVLSQLRASKRKGA